MPTSIIAKSSARSKQAFHFETLHIQHDRGSNFASQAINLGGSLVRNEINAVLAGEGCECTLNGLYAASGTQLVDNRTSIDHAKPHCASHELYKGILDGKARGVFNGKIFVRQDAQKTDAKQTNKTLLLSDDADHQHQAATRDLRRRRQMHARSDRRPARGRGDLLPAFARHRPGRGPGDFDLRLRR